MKNNFLWAVMISVVFISCTKDENEQFVPQEDISKESGIENDAMGSILLKPSIKGIIDVKVGKLQDVPIDDNFFYSLFKLEDGEYIFATNGFLNTAVDPIPLSVGSYRISGFRETTTIYPEFDEPRYETSWVDFEIKSGEVTEVSLVFELADVKVTIDFSSELLDVYPDITVSIKDPSPFNGDSNQGLTWTQNDNGRSGYFHGDLFDRVIGDLVVEIVATDQNTKEEIRVSKTYPEATINQHYNISLEYAGASSVLLNPIIDGEEDEIEETITFPN